MTIPASKVKALCTSSEVALVRASRKPELEQLSHAEVKRLAVRARKLFDKWQGLGRGQSRDRLRQTGSSSTDANTELKVQIFRETLDSFEARLAKLDASAAPKGKAAKPIRKKDRVADHRANRAVVRKGLNLVEELLDAGKLQRGKASKPAAAPKSKSPAKAAAQPVATKAVTKSKAPAAKKPAPSKPAPLKGSKAVAAATEVRLTGKLAVPSKAPTKLAAVSATKQLKAATAAKQSRVVRSGKLTRMAGHVGARGKRSQARRDSK